LLDIINKSCNFGLSVGLGMDCPMELVASCSQNPGQTSVSMWHTFCILAHYFSMANIPFWQCIIHLSLSCLWSTIGYRCKSPRVLVGILIVSNLH
jgi:hypothetical protein